MKVHQKYSVNKKISQEKKAIYNFILLENQDKKKTEGKTKPSKMNVLDVYKSLKTTLNEKLIGNVDLTPKVYTELYNELKNQKQFRPLFTGTKTKEKTTLDKTFKIKKDNTKKNTITKENRQFKFILGKPNLKTYDKNNKKKLVKTNSTKINKNCLQLIARQEKESKIMDNRAITNIKKSLSSKMDLLKLFVKKSFLHQNDDEKLQFICSINKQAQLRKTVSRLKPFDIGNISKENAKECLNRRVGLSQGPKINYIDKRNHCDYYQVLNKPKSEIAKEDTPKELSIKEESVSIPFELDFSNLNEKEKLIYSEIKQKIEEKGLNTTKRNRLEKSLLAPKINRKSKMSVSFNFDRLTESKKNNNKSCLNLKIGESTAMKTEKEIKKVVKEKKKSKTKKSVKINLPNEKNSIPGIASPRTSKRQRSKLSKKGRKIKSSIKPTSFNSICFEDEKSGEYNSAPEGRKTQNNNTNNKSQFFNQNDSMIQALVTPSVNYDLFIQKKKQDYNFFNTMMNFNESLKHIKNHDSPWMTLIEKLQVSADLKKVKNVGYGITLRKEYQRYFRTKTSNEEYEKWSNVVNKGHFYREKKGTEVERKINGFENMLFKMNMDLGLNHYLLERKALEEPELEEEFPE